MPDLPELEQRLAKFEDEHDSGWADYLRQQREMRERTARLRALRFARQQNNRSEKKRRRA
jgi:hypothetical protein